VTDVASADGYQRMRSILPTDANVCMASLCLIGEPRRSVPMNGRSLVSSLRSVGGNALRSRSKPVKTNRGGRISRPLEPNVCFGRMRAGKPDINKAH
jgi:hypothetical protein